MRFARAAFLLFGIILAVFAAAFLAWHDPAREPSPLAQTEAEGTDNAATRADQSNLTADDSGLLQQAVETTESAESFRPNIVTYKEGKPLWELSHEQLHEHVDDLRALVDAGWGQAVLPLTRLVSDCHGRTPPRSEREIRTNVQSRRKHVRSKADTWTEDRVQQELAHIEREFAFELEMANRWRIACNAVTDEDASRIMDWLDLALEQRHPEFLAGYLRWDILPEDRAWRIRHAERLALFNQRFEAAYLDGVYAGELSMLDLAWRLYAIEKVLPKTDPYRAFVFNHAADLAARDQLGMRRQYSESIRPNAANLDQQLVDEARVEAERIYDRCCADQRIPR